MAEPAPTPSTSTFLQAETFPPGIVLRSCRRLAERAPAGAFTPIFVPARATALDYAASRPRLRAHESDSSAFPNNPQSQRASGADRILAEWKPATFGGLRK